MYSLKIHKTNLTHPHPLTYKKQINWHSKPFWLKINENLSGTISSSLPYVSLQYFLRQSFSFNRTQNTPEQGYKGGGTKLKEYTHLMYSHYSIWKQVHIHEKVVHFRRYTFICSPTRRVCSIHLLKLVKRKMTIMNREGRS